MADPEAGRVDDLQIETPGRVDGFQIKWVEGAITFHSLVTPDGANPPLITQLSDGWTRLRQRFPRLKHAVHLSSNALPSTHDRARPGAPQPPRRDFAAFLNTVWAPLKASLPLTLPAPDSPWSPTFNVLQQASGLDGEDFIAFLRDLEIDLGMSLPIRPANPTRDEETYFRDLQHLTGELFRIVADRSRTVELDRAALVVRLGWSARLEFRSKHELHVDLQHYAPIATTMEELERAILTLRGGYLLLVGSPGSGKSSLLTLALRQEDVRLVRYYAFIPRSLNAERGESANFLHDVILSIEQDPQFRTGRGLSGFDRLHLLDRLRTQLALLHDDFVTTGRKTVIMVDGLDHIAREQQPARSLLNDLVPPDEVPEGILFVLGSQTDVVLPPPVQVEVQSAERRIMMQPLSREAVFAILSRNEQSSALSAEQKDRVMELTRGHPLALRYLLNQLEADGADAVAILASAQPYSASIDEQYRTHWPQIARHPELVGLLGRLARLRRPFELSWVEGWAGEESVNRLQTHLSHYFRRDRGRRWAFFHNSFQQFLLGKTIERAPGDVDEEKGRGIHRELADLCSGSPQGSTWQWEELFHRAESADWEWFDEHPTLDEVRAQVLTFRPLDAIERDLRLALRAVAIRQNPIALVRLALALKELTQREFHLENVSVIWPLLEMGEREMAFEHIREGDRLRISPEGALRLATSLHRAGEREEAQELFELAQPLELLAGDKPADADQQGDAPDVLRRWIRASLALRQRTIEQVLESITRIRLHEEHSIGGRSDADLSQAAQAELLVLAGRELIRDHRWQELEQVLAAFEGRTFDWSFWLLDDAWEECHRAGDDDRARGYHGRAAARLADDTEDSAKLSIAFGYWRLERDLEQARQVSALIAAPAPYTDTIREEGFGPFLDRFRYGRLQYVLGETRNPRELVPDPDNSDDQGAVYVLRALYRLARIAADADRERFKPWSILAQDVLPLLRLFNQGGRRWLDWSGWHAAESRRGEFFALLVGVVALHGTECRDELIKAFEHEWEDEGSNGWWSTDVQRDVILACLREGVARDWAVDRLAALEERMLLGRNATERTEEHQAQANAWLEVREPGRAKRTLQEMLRVSFGVGYRKDYQLNVWTDWLGRLLPVEPDRAISRITWFARATASLDETTEGKAARYAANRLLTVVFRWSPRRAIPLFVWSLEQRCLWFADALSELLETALDTTSPPLAWISAVLRHVLLPTVGQGSPEVATALLRVSRLQGGAARVQATATQLLEAVELRAMPGTRYGWKKRIAEQLAIDGLTEPHVDPGQPPRDGSSGSDTDTGFLRLHGGRQMNPEDVLAQANSLDAFRALLTDETSDSFFDWDPVIQQLRSRLNDDDLFILAQLIGDSRRATMSLAAISREFLRRGDRDKAWAIGEQALARSSSYGWTRWGDGGSRLAAFKALNAVDPDLTRPRMYQQLAEDGGGDAESLSEVLSLLAPALPLPAAWGEIERFCHGMFPETTLPDSAPQLPAQLPDDRPVTALSDLMRYLLIHPVCLLRESARRVCLELVLAGDSTVHELIESALAADDAQQEQALVVIGAAQVLDRNAFRPFVGAVRNCVQSPQWLVRRMAQKLLRAAGEEVPEVPRRPLAPIYELALPERPDAPEAGIPPPAPNEPIVQFGSAEELIAPFGDYLELVAPRAGCGYRNAAERAAQLMREITPSETWSADAERTLLSQLSSAFLKFPFIRPRVGVARRAVFQVAAELVDAGRIAPSDLDVVEGLCAFYDDVLEGLKPLSRDPLLVPPLSISRLGRALEWVALDDDYFEAVRQQTTDGRVVLAQWCKVKTLDWSKPTEIRESTVRATDLVARPSDDEPLFGRVSFARVVDYPREAPHRTPEALVVQNYVLPVDTVGVRWIAFNPSISTSLGWRLARDGIFRWADTNGDTLVETLWWQDGTNEMAPPHPHEEVGFGWVVVASRAAVEQLRQRFGALCRLERVSRRANEQGEGERRVVRCRASAF